MVYYIEERNIIFMKQGKKIAVTTKKIAALFCAASMLCGTMYISDNADAAKKPKLSNSTVRAEVGDSKTITVKNSAKKAKVTWKTSKPKIVKIAKKKSGKKAYAKVKALKEGSSTVTAVYKLGKKKTNLKCKVIVKEKPVVTATPTPAVQATQTPSNTPTATPVSQPTTEPTAVPYSWVTTWGTAEENFSASENQMPQALNGTTVRQIIKVTTSGDEFKLRLSNQYGKSDVVVHSMHLAKQVQADKSTIDVSTDTVVTVNGEEEFVIPAGEIIQTDGIKFSVDALDNVAISAYFGDAPGKANEMTGHRGARATTYQVSGNNVSEETFTAPTTTTAWYFLADASVMSPEGSKAVVCFGDSITDGYGTDASYLGRKPDSYTRWGDYFAKRLQGNEATKHISVINEGIGSNSMMGSYPTDAGKDRFRRDLLEHDGVGYCIVLFGVNDLNSLQDTSKYDVLKPEYEKMVELAHENGIKIYAAPILPFGTSSYYSEASEQVRTMLNDWMRSEESGFDGVIEFSDAIADPENPKNILEKYTHEDGLHPYDGYEAMAGAIDLNLFK